MTAMLPLRAAQAMSAYGAVGAETSAVSGAASKDFSSILTQSLGNAITTGQDAEAQAKTAIAGGGDLTSVVTAVSRAELTLQTTVAIRDRVLQAYQDIIKMPI